ncbi:hypothetical protein [Mycobacteroides abscessus]|uniref:hypothetical protein n=1 Tax=Mycobacteroides abscessus TaxID=36809 RepID=UPI0010427BAA|nr:hypothetical protein [Mycobacteroides abscessus]
MPTASQSVPDQRLVVVVQCPQNSERVRTRSGWRMRPVSIAVDWANDRVDHLLRHVPIYRLTGPRILKGGVEGVTVTSTLRMHDPVPQWIQDSTDGLRPQWVIR